jgi:hypothetical protein
LSLSAYGLLISAILRWLSKSSHRLGSTAAKFCEAAS